MFSVDIGNPAYEDELEPREEECSSCGKMVPDVEISPETDRECIQCQKIVRCICGDPLEECECCKPSMFERFRTKIIELFKNFI